MRTLTQSILLAILVASNTLAQPNILWTRNYGGELVDKAYCVQQTSDGGFIITGYSASYGNPYGDVLLLKTNADGHALWYQTYGGDHFDSGKCVQQTSDGGYIIAGFTDCNGSDNRDVYLIKTDEEGNELWSQTFGGDLDEESYSVQQTSDGGYIIAGFTESFGAGQSDVYLIKTDNTGQELWSRTFGGIYMEEGRCVRQTSDGGYIITGYTESFAIGINDVWLIKTDEHGNELWSQSLGRATNDKGYGVQQTADGGYIVVGYIEPHLTYYNDVYLVKTDSRGNERWARSFGGNNTDYGNSVQQTSDGGYIIAGTSFYELPYWIQGDVYLIKTNELGIQLWSQTIGGDETEFGQSVQQTSDGGYIVAGMTESYGAGQSDVYLIRLDSEGVPLGNSDTNIPEGLILFQANPNPFNQSTVVSYQLSAKSLVKLTVYDIAGREVAKLVDGYRPAGMYNVVFDGKDLVSGVYFARLTVDGGQSMVRKIVLMK